MLPTPSTSHIKFDNIYEPAEDSFLLLDTLSSRKEVEFLRGRFSINHEHKKSSPAPLIVELGVGSGVVLAFAAANAELIFGRADVLTLGTDLNEFSCKAASETVRKAIIGTEKGFDTECASNVNFLGSVNADLSGPIRSFETDLLIFNPPYVPTESVPDLSSKPHTVDCSLSKFDRDSHLLALSYAGGEDGMEVTNKLLSNLPNTLHRERGVAYILLCAQNKPENVKEMIRNWGPSWSAETVSRSGKSAGWENLQVLRIWRT